MKIAVVGAGVSGLVTAHLLTAQHHDVTVFEADARPGGHACTIDVDLGDGRTHPADVGFMVFNDRNYPRFEALLTELGVTWRTSDMSFSVSDGENFEYAGHSLGGLFANRRHLADPKFLRMVNEYRRFNRDGKALLASDDDPSLRQWLIDLNYSQHFVERLLVPQASAVWSADPAQMWTFPARFLVQFFDNHGMLGLTGRPEWRTVVGGSREYVTRIAERLGADRLRLDAPVQRVARTADGGVLVQERGRPAERYDEVVLACHGDQALAMLDDPTATEREVLGAFPYAPSELVLHSDPALLPRRSAAQASWNFHLLDPAPAAPTVTYDLGRLQGHDGPRPILATLNHSAAIDPAQVHATLEFAHPVFTPEGVVAQGRHAEVSGADRVHFAGAYWTWGFHEDGVRSAHTVADAIGAAAPELAVR